MIHKPHVDWFLLAPANSLLAAAALALLAAVLVPRWGRRGVGAFVAAAGFATAFVFSVLLFMHSPVPHPEVAHAVIRDRFGTLAQVLICAAGLLAVGVSFTERMRDDHVAEYYALLAAAGGGMCFLSEAFNLMTLFLAFEWFSISLYILCAIDVDLIGSLEAGLKYLIVGGFGSAALLFGSALVYGSTGQLTFDGIRHAIDAQHLRGDALLVVGLAMIITGLGFKASAAPFHMWTPDVYEGAPTPVTAFMSAATKVVALTLTVRVLRTAFPQEAHLWTIALAVIACASLAIGNLGALVQRNVKRLLAYSSVSNAGFMLIAVAANNALGVRALLYFLIPYGAMSIGAFGVVAARERELQRPVTLQNLAGFGWERPLLGFAMAAFMFGFVGFPLTGGFVGKFYLFASAYRAGWTWLVIFGAVATAVSLYYYLAVVRALYMRTGAELQFDRTTDVLAADRTPLATGGSPPPERLLQATVFTCLAITVASFVFVEPLIEVARKAAASIPF